MQLEKPSQLPYVFLNIADQNNSVITTLCRLDLPQHVYSEKLPELPYIFQKVPLALIPARRQIVAQKNSPNCRVFLLAELKYTSIVPRMH